jgi:hypothetical protein
MEAEVELQWRVRAAAPRASLRVRAPRGSLTRRVQPVADAAALLAVAGSRVRFLCLDACASHVALGASTGRRAPFGPARAPGFERPHALFPRAACTFSRARAPARERGRSSSSAS